MLLVSALLALAPTQPLPMAPPPRAAHGWVLRHAFTHKAPMRAITATADGYVTGDKDGVLILWDAKTGKLRETLLDGTNDQAKPIDAVRLAPDGKRLNVVANGLSGQIEMTGKDRTYYGPNPMWSILTLSDGGFWLASERQQSGNPRTFCALLLRFDTNGLGASWDHQFEHPADVRFAARAPGLVASADTNGTVYGWKIKPDQAVEQAAWSVDLKKHKPNALTASPDGTLVAVAGATGTVEVLNAKQGESVATLKGHTGAVRSVAFTPDSGLIATGGDDGTVRLWNPVNGEQEYLLKGHTGPIAAVWFASDDVLMSASDDKTARVWVYKS